MSELRKANTQGIPYFITMTVIGWIDLFTRKEICEIIVKNLRFAQNFRGLEIFAYVIMSNHIHMIARKIDGNLNDFIRDFKSYSAKEIINFIQNDPVKAGIVLNPEDYYYSSANPLSPLKVIEP